MEKRNRKLTTMAVLINISRYLLAAVLIASGFLKAVDPLGLLYKMQDYAVAFGFHDVPADWLRIFAMVLPAIEFLLGLFLLTGVYKRTTTRLITLFMVVMTLFTLYVAIYNPVSDCGCFGDAIVISNWSTFLKNIILLAMAIFVWLRNRSIMSRVSPINRFLVLTLGMLYIFFLQYVSLNHLPPIDFRPYKVGVNLREELNISPEELDQYAYFHTFERDGIQKEFTEEAAPFEDSTWHYVSSRTELVEKSEELEVLDFSLLGDDDEDYSETILSEEGYTFLIVLNSVEDADEGRVDIINDIYDHCIKNEIPFYAVTSSNDEAIGVWRKRTGAEYPILWADNTLLKTIVRANPALLLLKDGVIVEKCNVNDIPDIDVLTNGAQPYEKHIADNIYSYMRGWCFWIIAFILPLMLIIPLDVFMNRLGRAKKIFKDVTHTNKNETSEEEKEDETIK